MVSLQTKEREVDFDVETAIKVCRQAGYYDHALFLAKEHQLHEWYLKIQLEDIKDYQLTLEYIGKLDFDEVCTLSSNILNLPYHNTYSYESCHKKISMLKFSWKNSIKMFTI